MFLDVLTATLALAAWFPLERMLVDADAVILAEIHSTDYSATPADGPMYAEARVLRAVKGNLAPGRRIRFGASAWVSPTYKRGERRILFLRAVGRQHPYFTKAPWSTVESAGIELFFAEQASAQCSQAALTGFLRELGAMRKTPPRIELSVNGRDLSITVTNQGDQPLWLSPPKAHFSVEANGVRSSRAVRWNSRDEWLELKPRAKLAGLVVLEPGELGGAREITAALAHLTARFPNRCWLGAYSTKVKPGN